ncbi:MAG: hypothetical protein KDB01_17995 [Planctomycetaceae bacterium]|nr:hypothetical protein [Planctomycetaceae bacterium]
MRFLGQLLLWAGFMAAAYSAVCRLEQAADKWATIPWLWYATGMLVGITGIVLLRLAMRQDHSDDAKTAAEYSVVRQSLETIAIVIGRLCEQTEHQPSAVLRCIDDQCTAPFTAFADSRSSLVRKFGLKVYADVMTEFASAERYVNRSWSAAADGYIDEVKASLLRANLHLQKAKELLTRAEG